MPSSLYIVKALIVRDLYILRRSLCGDLLDAAILVTIQVMTYGYLLPLIGMPAHLSAPLFVGSGLFFIIITRGYVMAMRFAYKVPFEGFGILEYYLTLPLSPWLMLSHYIITFVIETCIITLPVFFVGLRLLPVPVTLSFVEWVVLISIYLQALVFWGIYYLATPFLYSFAWFRNNLWPRRLDPIICLSSTFFPWGAVYNMNSYIAYLLLISPSTYMVEGLRGALGVTVKPSLPLWLCVTVIGILIYYCWIRLHKAVIHRLDPVVPR
jgi:hypothetical protein